MDYEVKLEIFEGPLDLLLHLITKNEVDIFDIPIATITDQYLEYLEIMKSLNVNLAGDFLIMASTLIHIKSKMLLPDTQDEEGEEDPRMEITRSLLEYMQFRDVAEGLSEREMLDRDVFSRKVPAHFKTQLKNEDPQLDVNLFQLMDAFKRIVDQKLPGVQLKLKLDRWSVKEKIEVIIERMKQKGQISFTDLFDEDHTVSEFIVTFLALLELVHMGLVKVFQPTLTSDIQLIPAFNNNGENGNG